MEATDIERIVSKVGQNVFFDVDLNAEGLSAAMKNKISEGDLLEILDRYKSVMKAIAVSNMNANQLDAFLLSHTMKRQGGINEEESKAIKGFWIENQNAIKKSMVEKIQWNPTLENFNWRVCLKSGLPSNQLNTPVLDMELHIKDPMCNEVNNVQFEMDLKTLDHFIAKLKEADVQIQEYARE